MRRLPGLSGTIRAEQRPMVTLRRQLPDGGTGRFLRGCWRAPDAQQVPPMQPQPHSKTPDHPTAIAARRQDEPLGDGALVALLGGIYLGGLGAFEVAREI